MKKTLRTYTKRTVAVFMACLMLLTAWVFVAPQKADAVTGGKYTYRVVMEVTYARNCSGSVTVTWREKNGTGSSANDKTTSATFGSGTSNSTGTKYLITDSNGAEYGYAGYFPVGFSVYHKVETYAGFSSNWKFKAYVQIKNASGNWVSICSTAEHTGKKSKGDTETWANNPTSDSYPYCNSFTWDQQPSNISLKQYGASDTYNATDSVTTAAKYHATDQYGKLMEVYTPSVKYAVGDSTDPSSTDSTYLTVSQSTASDKNTATVSAKSGFRKNITSNYYATGRVTVVVTGKSQSKTYNSNTFKIYNPKFTYTYDKNDGSNIPSTGSLTPASYKFYYGRSVTQQKTIDGKSSTADLYPQNVGSTIHAKRAGFDFQGMYLASYIQYGQTFSAPSGAVKLTDSTTVFPTVNTSSSNDATTNANQTWYAAWLAKNIHVTYVNNDGSVLWESDYGKYNQKASYVPSGIPSGGHSPVKPAANPTYARAPGVTGTFEYEFIGWQVASAKQYSLKSDGTQEQIDYSAIVGDTYDNAVLLGDTVFVATYRIASTKTYSITYKNASQSNTVGGYHYKDNGKTGSYATATLPAADAENNKYTYEFLGWAQQVNSNDTVYWQNWDADLGAYVPEDNAQTPLTDYKVYDNATWVAVYGRKYIDYTVTFNFVGVTTDETGAKTYNAGNKLEVTKHYDESIEIPEVLSYTGGKLSGTAPAGASYSNSTGYTYDFNAWSPALSGSSVAVAALSGWTGSANAKAKTFNATYTAVPATYHIYFVAPDTAAGADGIQYAQYDEDDALLTKVLNTTTEFSHGSSVNNMKNMAEAAVVRTYRDDDNEYTFTGWAPTYASTATDNVTYTAQYDVSPLYTVTYMDESGERATWKGTTAQTIPLYPEGLGDLEKADDLYATGYTFSGWAETEYDAKNPAPLAIAKDGSSSMNVPEGGTTVYAQFTCTPIDYVINFNYYDQTDEVVKDHETTYEYGDEIAVPTEDDLYLFETVDGVRKRIHSYQDNKYYYTYSAWDHTPSETVTGNATYTANYRKSYVYYDVIWLYQNGRKCVEDADHNLILDDENGKDFRNEKYTYGERIRTPFSSPAALMDENNQFVLTGLIVLDEDNKPIANPGQPDGQHTYGFDRWICATKDANDKWIPKLDSNGCVIPFSASTYIEEGVTYAYLPTYKLEADLKTLTILDEDGTVLGTMQIGVGKKILDYVDNPKAKNPDDSNHYAFDKWIYVSDNTEVGASDTMSVDTTIQAVYEPKAHSYALYETLTAPTFDAEGNATFRCEDCGYAQNVTLPALTDEVLPGIRLYVKTSIWDSVDPTALTPLDDTVIPIAPNSLLIANGTDKADPSVYYVNKTTLSVTTTAPESLVNYETVTYNADEKGSGVNEIWAYYTAAADALALDELETVANSTDENPDGWHNIYQRVYNAETGEWSTEEANHSDVFASFDPALVDGQQYVVYLKAIDANGNVNYISSKKVGYDTTVPEVTLTTVAGGNEAGTKFCLDTTIVLDEADLTVLLDGDPITMTAVTSDEDETTTYEYAVTAVGKHTVRVTDPAGNETMKAFEILGDHRTTETYKAVTCTENGWKKTVCTICGSTIGAVTTYDALGHDWAHHDAVEATCLKEGREEYWSCNRCNKLFSDANGTTEVTRDELSIPRKTEHVWDNGEITKQPNCTQNGKKAYKCTICGFIEEIDGDLLDVTMADYDEETAAAILAEHPDLQVTQDVPRTDPETGEPVIDDETGEQIIDKVPVQATDAFGNPAYIQKTDSETDAPLFTETPATVDGKPVYNSDNSVAYLPDYDTTQPIYCYTIVHHYTSTNHSLKIKDYQTVAPTCEDPGVITHECRYCGLRFFDREADALEHNWTADEADENAWIVVDPSCDADGYKYPAKCARCGEANTEQKGKVVIDKLVHDYVEDTELSVAPRKDDDDNWIIHHVFIGDYYIVDPENDVVDLDNIDNDAPKSGEVKDVRGYKVSVCSHDQHHIRVTEDIPEVEYTYTFKNDEGATLATLTKHAGNLITLAEVPTATKNDTLEYHYTFDKWMDGTGEDAKEATFPMSIDENTGNKTFYATFKQEPVYYTITFKYVNDNGTTESIASGFKTYTQKFVQVGPEKASDANYDYTFRGWHLGDEQPANPDALTDTDLVLSGAEIEVLGNATYWAVYSQTARKYSVAWVIGSETVVVDQDIAGGTPLQELYDSHLDLLQNPTKEPDDHYHYTFSNRWNPALSSSVTGNMMVKADFDKTEHNMQVISTTPATCTARETETYKCSGCDYSYTKQRGSALGHDWVEQSSTDTTITYKCSRCPETKTEDRPNAMVNLTITVKDSSGNPVSGARVRVYDGNNQVASGTTGGDGKVTVRVPGNKTYRVEIDGDGINSASGSITVDQNGNITAGGVPTVSRIQSGCDCTCHKSGFWPMIFRFFHKIIKMITGEFRCCADANY